MSATEGELPNNSPGSTESTESHVLRLIVDVASLRTTVQTWLKVLSGVTGAILALAAYFSTTISSQGREISLMTGQLQGFDKSIAALQAAASGFNQLAQDVRPVTQRLATIESTTAALQTSANNVDMTVATLLSGLEVISQQVALTIRNARVEGGEVRVHVPQPGPVASGRLVRVDATLPFLGSLEERGVDRWVSVRCDNRVCIARIEMDRDRIPQFLSILQLGRERLPLQVTYYLRHS